MASYKEYLIEIIRVGKQKKVTACDPESGVEVSTMGPSSATRKELSDLAVKKLRYVLARDEERIDDAGEK